MGFSGLEEGCAAVSKTVEHASVPRVRIPYSPPLHPLGRLGRSRFRRYWIASLNSIPSEILGGSTMARAFAECPIPARARSRHRNLDHWRGLLRGALSRLSWSPGPVRAERFSGASPAAWAGFR